MLYRATLAKSYFR